MAEEVKILYSRTPITVLSNKDIRVASAVLLGEVIALSQREGYSYATNDHYAERLGVSPRSITDYMSELESHEYIRRVQFASSKNKTERHIYVNYKKLEIETEELRAERLNQEATSIEITPEFFGKPNNTLAEVADSLEESARGIEESARGVEENDRGGVKNLLGGIEESANKDSIHYSINHSINNSIKESIKDDDSETKAGISKNSQQVEKPSSKDNRPIGLSLPNVNDESLSTEISQSDSSKEKPKIALGYSIKSIASLPTDEVHLFHKVADLYPNKNNLDDAAWYFSKVASLKFTKAHLEKVIAQTPEAETMEFLEFLKRLVEDEKASSLKALQPSSLKT